MRVQQPMTTQIYQVRKKSFFKHSSGNLQLYVVDKKFGKWQDFQIALTTLSRTLRPGDLLPVNCFASYWQSMLCVTGAVQTQYGI